MTSILHKYELHRMIGWLLWSVVFYFTAIYLREAHLEPQLQVLAWKLGNVTIAAYGGYWIDRRAFARITHISTDMEQIRRAIIMAAAMITVGLGL